MRRRHGEQRGSLPAQCHHIDLARVALIPERGEALQFGKAHALIEAVCAAVCVIAAYLHGLDLQNGVTTRVHSAAFGGETFLGAGLHNPSYKDIQYLIERVQKPCAVFAHVIESGRGEMKIENVTFEREERGVRIAIAERGGNAREIRL